MSTSNVHAVFDAHNSAHAALEAAIKAGVPAERISVIGEDCDAFRFATSTLHAKKVDRLIVLLGLVGLAVGTGWGIMGLPSLWTSGPAHLAAAIFGGFCGAMLGLLAGAHAGAILHLDNGPSTDAVIKAGSVKGALLAVSVRTNSASELQSVQNLFFKHGANKLAIEFR
jgi:hypothetical protein